MDDFREWGLSGDGCSGRIREFRRRIVASSLNAFINVNPVAESQCPECGQSGELALGGMAMALKDNICEAQMETTCASDILTGFLPAYDAQVVARLRAAGAVILGKTNLDEFAMGSTTATSNIGPTLNPWNTACTPGGSSGGSAAAVAAGLCDAALGSDTGGSVRQPAAFCGITGLKPTYGSVSRYGLVAFASSLDQIGPMARTAAEVARVYAVIRGHDERDSTSVARDYAPIELAADDLAGLRIGIPKEFFGEGLDREVAGNVRAAIERLRELGAVIVEVGLPHVRYGVAVYYIIATAEASSNLARYDGVRYGRRVQAATLQTMYLKTRGEGFGPEVKRRIMLGTHVLSAGYYDQYYGQAARVRTLIADDFRTAFNVCDLIAGPTSPVTAFRLDELPEDPLSIYLQDIYTIPANLAGIPALSLPCGFDSRGLPVGLQLMAPAFGDELLLNTAHVFQKNTGFHREKPHGI